MAEDTTNATARPIGGGRRLALFALLVLAAALGATAVIAAVSPTDGPGLPERWIEAGNLEAYEPGTITSLPIGPVDPPTPPLVHVSRLEDGDLIVIAGRDPLGCAVPWRPNFRFEGTEGWFRDPCKGSTYDDQGRQVSGPSPRDLDRLAFEVTPSGTLRIEVSHPIQAPTGRWPR